MNCEDADILLHALIDNELDAGHAREVEAHLAGCPRCTSELQQHREMRRHLSSPELRYVAPQALRSRIENSLPLSRPVTTERRTLLKGFAMGSVVSAAMAASVMLLVTSRGQNERLLGDVASAHLRSLQAQHLTDVDTSDQHTVKPWFNGRIDVAPPVIDLTAQGFRLIGGRLDYIDGRPAAAIVYKRRAHVINLFVAQSLGARSSASGVSSVQGFNIQRWTERGLDFLAISDLAPDELQEFARKFQSGLRVSNDG